MRWCGPWCVDGSDRSRLGSPSPPATEPEAVRRHQKADEAEALSPVGLQELEHPGVVGLGLACQGPGHGAGQVQVTHGDGVRISEREASRHAHGPRPATRDPTQDLPGLRRLIVEARVDDASRASRRAQPRGSLSIHAGSAKVLRGEAEPLPWRRWEEEPSWARGSLVDAAYQVPVAPGRLAKRDPLLEDHLAQHVEDEGCTAQVKATPTPRQGGQWPRRGLEDARAIVEPQDRLDPVQCPVGSRAPRPNLDVVSLQSEVEGNGPLRRTGGLPDVARPHSTGRVVQTKRQKAE